MEDNNSKEVPTSIPINDKDTKTKENISDWAKRWTPENDPEIVKEIEKFADETEQNVNKLKSDVIQEKKKNIKALEKSTEPEKEKKNGEAGDSRKISILDLFEGLTTETSSAYKMECPDCGLQGGRTEGFIIWPENNTAFCHTSGKHFKMLEAYALKKKIIRCIDGRENGDNNTKILGGELYTLVLEEFRNEFGTEMYNQLSEQLKIRQPIEIPGDNRLAANFSDELGDIYKSRNILFFREESNDIIEIERMSIGENKNEYIGSGFRPMDGKRFITLAEMFIKPWTLKMGFKSGKMKRVGRSMTESMASVALASPNLQKKLPAIKRILDTQIPFMHENELTFPKKGYDKRFKTWLPYNAPQIKTNLFTLEQAKSIIDKIFEEFCFASEKDRTHAIAAFITPFLRGIFPKFSIRTPIFIYMANRERAGKDYCAGCNGILYEGYDAQQPPISTDEKGYSNHNEELRKKITACMLAGNKRFHSSNNKGLLDNSVLEQVTTDEVWKERLLGGNKMGVFNNEMDFSLSGNLGIRLTPDLANRARIINLHLIDEDANARIFKNPKLHEWIFENRGMIVSALYKLVENWIEKGKPKGSVPFTSFPYWAEICGGIMEAAGYCNPCEKDKSVMISLDVETEEMKLLFESCYFANPNQWMKKEDIQNIVISENIMPSLNFNDKADQIKFGLKIDRYTKRVLSDIYMRVDSLEQRSSRRKFMFTKEVPINFELNDNSSNVVPKCNIIPKKDVELRDFDPTYEKTNKSGNDGNLGNDLSTLPCDTIVNNRIVLDTLPSLPSLPNKFAFCEKAEPTENEKTNLFGNLGNVLGTTPKIVTPVEDLTKMYKDSIKKDEEEAKKDVKKEKEKTDRELQFYESPETKNIVSKCTQDQVLEWVKNNPKVPYKELKLALGLGCLKHIQNLAALGLIKVLEIGWEVNSNV